MTAAKQWTVDIYISEYETSTRAEARLHTQDRTHLVGHGEARLNPTDRQVPEIGDELCVARALEDLSHALLHAAIDDIEGVTHEKVTLSQ